MFPDKILMVDKAYKPLGLITWQDCYKKLAVNKVRFLVEPDIVQLMHRIVSFDIQISYSKKNIALRDKNICQYCGIKCGHNNASIDHVIPESRGGETSFLNCVLACIGCNTKKRDKTPHEAGMKLLRAPFKPNFLSLLMEKMSSDTLTKFYAWANTACESKI